jgi:ATP-binding cassette subfamily C protein/ATP-binding cassette subfamily C protein LapB
MSNEASSTFSSFDELGTALRGGKLGEFQAKSDFAACLIPLLEAIGWRSELREITEALPHFANTLNLSEFRNVMARLGYKTILLRDNVALIDSRLVPCLFVADSGGACVLLKKEGQVVRLFDGVTGRERAVKASTLHGNLYLVALNVEKEAEDRARKDNWMRELFGRFRGLVMQLALLTFFLNIIAMLIPLFIMAVYDQVIPTNSISILGYLMIGISVAFIIEGALRVVRSRMVAFLGGRVEHIVATNTFRQIISLPASLTESAPLGSQVARVKEFDSIRELFIGPLTQVLLEAPFTLIFILVIALLGGSIALIPIAMMLVFGIISVLLMPKLKRTVADASRVRAERHSFLVEAVTNMRTIKEAGAEETWLGRYRDISAESSFLHFQSSQVTFLFQTLAQAIMMFAGLATIGLGVLNVLDMTMSVGALIATMALVWRVLAPLHSLFLTLSRFEQIKISIKQINNLMKMTVEGENKDKSRTVIKRRFRGAINLSRVSFRYNPAAEPALLGVNNDIKPGEMVAITGANGAGKSTILRLILGMHTPQAGQVTIDGMDIRQINPIELRQSIAYVPQIFDMFHGSISQNLRLANPVATDNDLKQATKMSGVYDQIMEMPDGFDTRMGDNSTGQFSSGLLQRISISRAYLKKASVILMDEPAQSLDDSGDEALMKALKKIKGSSTIIMVSHRPSHMKLADRLIVLNGGLLILDGKPSQVLERLAGGGA